MRFLSLAGGHFSDRVGVSDVRQDKVPAMRKVSSVSGKAMSREGGDRWDKYCLSY